MAKPPPPFSFPSFLLSPFFLSFFQFFKLGKSRKRKSKKKKKKAGHLSTHPLFSLSPPSPFGPSPCSPLPYEGPCTSSRSSSPLYGRASELATSTMPLMGQSEARPFSSLKASPWCPPLALASLPSSSPPPSPLFFLPAFSPPSHERERAGGGRRLRCSCQRFGITQVKPRAGMESHRRRRPLHWRPEPDATRNPMIAVRP